MLVTPEKLGLATSVDIRCWEKNTIDWKYLWQIENRRRFYYG